MTIEDTNAIIKEGQEFESKSGKKGKIVSLVRNEFYGGATALVGVYASLEGVTDAPVYYPLGQFYFTPEDGHLRESKPFGFLQRFDTWYAEVEKVADKYKVTPRALMTIQTSREARDLQTWAEFHELTEEALK